MHASWNCDPQIRESRTRHHVVSTHICVVALPTEWGGQEVTVYDVLMYCISSWNSSEKFVLCPAVNHRDNRQDNEVTIRTCS